MLSFVKKVKWFSMVAALAVLFAACGGGGGGGAAGGLVGGSYTVSGTVTGLAGSGLVLEDNGGDDLGVTADGPFTFATPVANGNAYSVTVKAQPAKQTCTVNDGSGTMAGTNISNVTVTCSADTYAVGGSVSGLSGSGLVLQDNNGDDLAVSANGSFAFATKLADGANYSVTVKTQPSNPTQTCSASSNTGTIDGADVTNVAVVCSTNSYSVGGSVSGYTSSGLVLQDNGTDDLTVSATGSFTFATKVASGAGYAVTVKTQPAGQTCSVSSGGGTVGGSNVTSVSISCADNPKHTVGGTVTGVAALGLVLQDNGGDDLAIMGNGNFTFATSISEGLGYNVTVKTQPPNQSCSVGNGTGTVSSGNVTNINVVCASTAFSVGGNVNGLSGGTLVLQDNGGDDLNITGNGSFAFSTPVANGATYNVTIKTQPAGQTCSLIGNSGKISGADITYVTVNCATTAYTVGGMVSGLTGTGLVLQNNSGDDLSPPGNGGFTFATPLADTSSYFVSVKTQPSGQTCSVTNASGTVNGASITSVSVMCSASYTIYVDIEGLSGSVTIQNNGVGGMSTSGNGTKPLVTALDGSSYNVTVSSQPVNQTCMVANGVGTISGADVTNIAITCATNTYSVGGTESGLAAGKTLVLQNNGTDDLTITNMFFTFAMKVAVGDPYNVTVKTQPAGQTCSVSNGSGVMIAADVTNIAVNCSSTTYSVGGMVSGLTGTIVLRNNGGDDTTVTANGPFTILSPLADNAGYVVTVKSSGTTQYCSVANGSGTISSANVTNVGISCSTTPERFAYVTVIGPAPSYSGTWGAYAIDGTGGALAPIPTSTNNWGNGRLAAATFDGKYLYFVDSTAKTLTAFSVNAATGALSSVASYATGTSPNYMVIDPTSSFLYISNAGSNSVFGFAINGSTGELTQMSGSPFIAGTTPESITIDPAGTHAYVVNSGAPSSISEYNITAVTGVLTAIAGSPFATGGLPFGKQNPSTVVISADGKYAYVPDYWGNKVVVYNVDSSGALTTEIAGSPFAAGTHPYGSAVLDGTGSYLYVSNGGSGSAGSASISAYSVNKATGALTELTGSPYVVGSVSERLFLNAADRFLFVATKDDSSWPNTSVFLRNASTGQLTAVEGSPFFPHGTSYTSGTLYSVTW